MKPLEYTQNHHGIFLILNQFRGSPIEAKIWCRNCQKSRDAYHAKHLKQLQLIPPQGISIQSFCAACGWMYQKQAIALRTRIAVEKMDKRECVYCGLRKSTRFKFGLDHLIPEIEGGEASVSNLVLACRECNSAKGRSKNYYKPRFGRFKKMTLKYLITTRFSPNEIFNKYAIYDGESRLRTQAGHTNGNYYNESKAEREMKADLQKKLGDKVVVQSMPDPADHHYVLFEALRPVKETIEIK